MRASRCILPGPVWIEIHDRGACQARGLTKVQFMVDREVDSQLGLPVDWIVSGHRYEIDAKDRKGDLLQAKRVCGWGDHQARAATVQI
jgi:hypothetical protein